MFRLRNRVITTPIIDILKQIRYENGNLIFSDIRDKGSNIMFTCPYHAMGQEHHPSAAIFVGEDDRAEFGVTHCFTCGKVVPLVELVCDTMRMDSEQATDWLIDNFSDTLLESPIEFPNLDLEIKKDTEIDISILKNYNFYHPYMWKRKLSKEAVDYLGVGYDPKDDCITFPVFDVNNKLRMVTKRSTKDKHFYIPEGIEKPVYLLNFILRNNFPYVMICESQINALTGWTYGIPAGALIGTGSSTQYQILNKSGITNYVLAFDGDNAGRKGAERFKERICKDAFITDIIMPPGKDINDLSKEEVDKLLNDAGITWRFKWEDIKYK